MAEKNKKSVGLIVITKHPQTSDPIAVLVRRGKYNHEKGWSKESYPGACQVTVHGKLESEESPIEALFREIREELGDVFLRIVKKLTDPPRLVWEDAEMGVRTYGVAVHHSALSFIALGPSSGGLQFVTCEEVKDILNLRTFDKSIGVKDVDTVAMFPDEIEALKAAFDRFGFSQS